MNEVLLSNLGNCDAAMGSETLNFGMKQNKGQISPVRGRLKCKVR